MINLRATVQDDELACLHIERINLYRERKMLSWDKVIRKTGISRSAYYSYINHMTYPTVIRYNIIAAYFSLPEYVSGRKLNDSPSCKQLSLPLQAEKAQHPTGLTAPTTRPSPRPTLQDLFDAVNTVIALYKALTRGNSND